MVETDLTALLEELRAADPYRAHGPVVPCPTCRYPVRRIETQRGGTTLVAPFPLRGDWDRPPAGYTEGPYLWTFPSHVGRAEGAGWKGGAKRFYNPPPTVEGYRYHALDCPGVATG